MARVLLVGLGSSGDVNPLLGLAEGLGARGHEVTLISAPPFASAAGDVGADFAPLGTAEAYEAVYAHPDLWHARKGLGVFFPYAAGLASRTVEVIEERHLPGETVVAATFQCFGARVAQEALGVPLATVLPNPILLQSVHDPNRNPIANPPAWLGRRAVRWTYWLANRELSRHARAGVGEALRARGLAPVRDVVGWCYSPELVLGLWPPLLSAPQPDWPPAARATGFIRYDGPAARAWRPPEGFDVERDDWVVFTPGTQMTHGAAFFEAAADAAARLGRPTLLVCPDASVLPRRLPDEVLALPFAPFAWLFERSAAVVHHGGIGTAGRALAAGVPQLVVPSGFDQFDNAARVARLGVGRRLDRKRVSGAALETELRALLEGEAVRARCREVRAELAGSDPLDAACDAIEGLIGRSPTTPGAAGAR